MKFGVALVGVGASGFIVQIATMMGYYPGAAQPPGILFTFLGVWVAMAIVGLLVALVAS